MFGPENLEEAKRYRYNRWGGNPEGYGYQPSYCAAPVSRDFITENGQCLHKPGHGPDKIFCKQHARMREGKK